MVLWFIRFSVLCKDVILGGCILNICKARFSRISCGAQLIITKYSFAGHLYPFTASAQFSKFKVT